MRSNMHVCFIIYDVDAWTWIFVVCGHVDHTDATSWIIQNWRGLEIGFNRLTANSETQKEGGRGGGRKRPDIHTYYYIWWMWIYLDSCCARARRPPTRRAEEFGIKERGGGKKYLRLTLWASAPTSTPIWIYIATSTAAFRKKRIVTSPFDRNI